MGRGACPIGRSRPCVARSSQRPGMYLSWDERPCDDKQRHSLASFLVTRRGHGTGGIRWMSWANTFRLEPHAPQKRLWDRAEPQGYMNHLLAGDLSTPHVPHKILIHMATHDSEVSNVGTEIMVRSLGVKQVTPVHRSFFQIARSGGAVRRHRLRRGEPGAQALQSPRRWTESRRDLQHGRGVSGCVRYGKPHVLRSRHPAAHQPGAAVKQRQPRLDRIAGDGRADQRVPEAERPGGAVLRRTVRSELIDLAMRHSRGG